MVAGLRAQLHKRIVNREASFSWRWPAATSAKIGGSEAGGAFGAKVAVTKTSVDWLQGTKTRRARMPSEKAKAAINEAYKTMAKNIPGFRHRGA